MVLQTFPQKHRLAQSHTKQLYSILTQLGAPVVILCLNLNRQRKPENSIPPFYYVFVSMFGFVSICETV